MGSVIRSSWALLLGVLMMLIGNGLQGGLLAYRGAAEGFSPTTMSYIMTAYFIGFLIGSNITTSMITRVGHVRVFAGFASIISAAFILFPFWPNPYFWALLRLIIGIGFAGVYIVSESWLNNATENENRGKALSAYLIAQMLGVISAGWLLQAAPVSGYQLFVVMSVLVSIAFTPMLLSATKAPIFESTSKMSFRALFKASPLGCVSVFVLGGVFALMFGMVGVYATQKGLGIDRLSLIITGIYIGGLVAQYPVGWLSDRMDRRQLLIILNAIGGITLLIGLPFADHFIVILILMTVVGAVTHPLYSLTIAYTNDRIEWSQMAAASSGMMFLNGLGAVGAPLAIGYLMSHFGADSYIVAMALMYLFMAVYGRYRSGKRNRVAEGATGAYAAVGPSSTVAVLDIVQDYVIDAGNFVVDGKDRLGMDFDEPNLPDAGNPARDPKP